MLEFVLYSACIGIISYVYVLILQDTDMILSWLPKYAYKLPMYLHKPLATCEYCVGGQIALWSNFFLFEYNIIGHILFICLTIFTIKLFNRYA